MSTKLLKCRRCGTYPDINIDDNNCDPLTPDTRYHIFCKKCRVSAMDFSLEKTIEKWNRVHGKELIESSIDKIAAAAVHDIENILRAAEGRYTFICRFCAHWKTKDCCDKDGKCTPEWRGVTESEMIT